MKKQKVRSIFRFSSFCRVVMLAKTVVVAMVGKDQLLGFELLSNQDWRAFSLYDLNGVSNMLCQGPQFNLRLKVINTLHFSCDIFQEISFRLNLPSKINEI